MEVFAATAAAAADEVDEEVVDPKPDVLDAVVGDESDVGGHVAGVVSVPWYDS